MTTSSREHGPFPSADEDARVVSCRTDSPQCLSPSYRLAFQDQEFLLRKELRPVRLQLELLKPELILQEQQIESTIVIYGSARLPDPESAREEYRKIKGAQEAAPDDAGLKTRLARAERSLANSRYYEEARKLGQLISQSTRKNKLVIITGAGAGIMEGAGRGAHDVGAKSIGLNIVLPFEQAPNRYVTPELSFQFHYFAIRKMHLLMRAKGLVAFPGGFGTLDELFETLTLVQTGKVEPIPILLFGREFWDKIVSFQALVDEGTISPEDLELFSYVETAEEAWEILARANGLSA